MQSNPYRTPVPAEIKAPNPPAKPRPSVLSFSGVFPTIVALWTVTAISAAADDKSWLALGIAFFYGPAVNLLLAVLGATYLAVRQMWKPGMDWGSEAMLIVITTLASAFAIFGATLTMELHGC